MLFMLFRAVNALSGILLWIRNPTIENSCCSNMECLKRREKRQRCDRERMERWDSRAVSKWHGHAGWSRIFWAQPQIGSWKRRGANDYNLKGSNWWITGDHCEVLQWAGSVQESRGQAVCWHNWKGSIAFSGAGDLKHADTWAVLGWVGGRVEPMMTWHLLLTFRQWWRSACSWAAIVWTIRVYWDGSPLVLQFCWNRDKKSSELLGKSTNEQRLQESEEWAETAKSLELYTAAFCMLFGLCIDLVEKRNFESKCLMML